MRIGKQFAAVLAGLSLLTGCSALPAQGPSTSAVVSDGAQSDDQTYEGYLVFNLDARVADILGSQPDTSLRGRFGDRGPSPSPMIGIGDSISVAIWEAAAGGLFSSPVTSTNSTGSRSVVIPEQVVARDGSITVPYAGRIPVAGLTPPAVERRIVSTLVGKAIEPQALVTVSRNIANTVTVTGEVVSGARVPLTTRGDRIVDVIAQAGGVRSPVHETFISLTRGGHTVTTPMQTLLDRPSENIFARPGDTLTVVRHPQTFTAFGATGRNTIVPFDARGITIEEAVAKAGGLLDYQSDPSAVFILRQESLDVVRRLDPNFRNTTGHSKVNVVYRVDLSNTNTFFLARRVAIRNKDIVYVANAPLTSVQKVLGVVQQVASPVATGKALAQ